MGDYQDILKDIETTIGLVPGFMKALADDVLIKEWPLFKKYVLGESKIPAKYRGNDRIGYRCKHQMSVLYTFPYSSRKATWC